MAYTTFRQGEDVTLTVAVVDAANAAIDLTAHDDKVRVYVRAGQSFWRKYSTDATDQANGFEATTVSGTDNNELALVLPEDVTKQMPLTTVYADVEGYTADTDYPDDVKREVYDPIRVGLVRQGYTRTF